MAVVDKRILIRMRKELKDLEQTPPGVVCYPVNDNIVHLQAEIAGPEDSPYHGGSFKIDIHIPERYPFEPPRCQFLTRVYHPNIDEQGLICLDILKTQPKGTWLPSINITTMLISLQLLLAQPNPDDPLLVDVATEFKENRELFKYKAKEFTKQYATGTQDTKDTLSGSGGETRMVTLKELESVKEDSVNPSTTSLSQSSSSAWSAPPTPVTTTALSLKTGFSGSASAPTERMSLSRPTHKKLTLSRRPTASAAASAASAASAPFVAPRRKSSVDQGSVLETRELTPDKVQEEELTPAFRAVKGESMPESVYVSQNKPTSQQPGYPTLQDTIPATNYPTPQNTSPDTDTTTTGASDTEAIKADKKRGAESIKSKEPTADTEVKTKKIKSEKRLGMRSKPLKRFSSLGKEETSKYFAGPPSPLSTPVEAAPETSAKDPTPSSTLPVKDSTPPPTPPVESIAPVLMTSLKVRKSPAPLSPSPLIALESPVSITGSNSSAPTPSDSSTALPAGMEVDQSTTPRSPARPAAKSSSTPPRSQELSVVNSSRLSASPLIVIASTKSAPKESRVIEDMSSAQETMTQEPELQPPPSPGSSDASEQLQTVSPYSKNKGKSKAVDDFKMDMDPRETDQNEPVSRTAHKRQDGTFSFMDDVSTTTTTTTTVSTETLTVAKKRNLLKKNRK